MNSLSGSGTVTVTVLPVVGCAKLPLTPHLSNLQPVAYCLKRPVVGLRVAELGGSPLNSARVYDLQIPARCPSPSGSS